MWKEKQWERDGESDRESMHSFKKKKKKNLNYALCPSTILFIQVPEDHE